MDGATAEHGAAEPPGPVAGIWPSAVGLRLVGSGVMLSAFRPVFPLGSISAFPTFSAYWYRPETPEERAERLAEEAEWARQQEEQAAGYRAAEELAERLLRLHLSPAQQADLKTTGAFSLSSQHGHRYRIRRGKSMNVDRLTWGGRVGWTYCAYPTDNVPPADAMLAQKVQLECDEDAFLRVANRSRPYGWREP